MGANCICLFSSCMPDATVCVDFYSKSTTSGTTAVMGSAATWFILWLPPNSLQKPSGFF